MDGITLDGTLAELRTRVTGRHVGRVRLFGRHALLLEVSRERLWIDGAAGSAGLYWLSSPHAKTLEALAVGEPSGAARQFLLHARKHVAGARIGSLRRLQGHRLVLLELGEAALALRLAGTPALTLVVSGGVVATLGDGAPAWPLPEERPEREWDRVTTAALARVALDAEREGRDASRALVAACPTLTRRLLEEVATDPSAWPAVQARLAAPRPIVLLPGPPPACDEADLAASPALIVPFALPGHRAYVHEAATWIEAGTFALEALLRGRSFAAAQRAALHTAAHERQRAFRLVEHLRADAAGLPEPTHLRRLGEALLAHGGELPHGASEVEVRDPRGEGTLRVAVDPRLSGPANADRLFSRARRMDLARRTVQARLEDAAAALAASSELEERASRARRPQDLHAPHEPAPDPSRKPPKPAAGPRHYLTSRGVSVLVGRGARENHELTFATASPEDLWLHARDVPGAHVILRDREHRAGAEDIREAAEVAAFFSDAAAQPAVDVHVTRRKHIRPGRGSAGKVLIGHSDTVRATPRNPDGRLRRR